MQTMTKIANLAKNRQMAGEKLNEVTRGAPYRVEKLTKMATLAKIGHGFGKYSNWMTKVVSWRVAVMTRMANITKLVKPVSNGVNGESGEKSQVLLAKKDS